jgi:hypothetical protein
LFGNKKIALALERQKSGSSIEGLASAWAIPALRLPGYQVTP